MSLHPPGPAPNSDSSPTLLTSVCGRCYTDTTELFPSGCRERPEDLGDSPIGQYHCPECGAMVMAGVPHPGVCALCRDQRHPVLDK